MKCPQCRSDIGAHYGRCFICGAAIKKVQQVNLKEDCKKVKRTDYTMLSYAFGILLAAVLICLLLYVRW
jgi:predicted nucleic acid-binding Zn ribbon protein